MSKPVPNFPKKTILPLYETTSVKLKGSFSQPTSTTFYYAGIQAMWLWWLVDLDLLTEYVKDFELLPYDFGGGKGAVNVNFFNAAAMYGMGQPGDPSKNIPSNPGEGGFNETEVNVVAYAKKVKQAVPQGISLAEFLANGEPTKRVGNMRLWVACDNAIAVAAGQQVFLENKFLTPYEYNVPTFNNPSPPDGDWTWNWTCFDPTETTDPAKFIYSATVDLEGESSRPSNMSEWIDLSWDAEAKRPVGSRRNFFGMYDTFMLPRGSGAVSLEYGKSAGDEQADQMRKDMKALIGSKKPKAIQTYVSPPCIAESAGYYADL